MVARASAVGHLLKRYRLAAGLTQEQLAERAGLSTRAISDLERGSEPHPHPNTVLLLAAALVLEPSARAALIATASSEPVGPASRLGDTSATDHRRRSNLPVALTSFVGRERELREVTRLLRATRLLTLTGSGGCGKSRLALEIGHELASDYAGGVWLVELAAISDHGLVPSALARVLGLQEEPDRPPLQTLCRYLGERQVLIIWDNCEHLIDACARLAEAILRTCPRVQILATSREGLGIGGEALWRVPSLEVPPVAADPTPDQLAEYDAIQLFLDRARDADPALVMTGASAGSAVEICRRLDGIPLAIELAAARTRHMSVQQIADRLDDRFRLLTTGARTALTRHQTLRASIDWSYGLLSEGERTLLNRLSVFVGGFTLDLAEAVCAAGVGDQVSGVGVPHPLPGSLPPDTQHLTPTPDVLDLLSRLVEKSLVIAEPGDRGDNRYLLLETIRQYARDHLVARSEAEAAEREHAEAYLAFAEEAEPELQGREQAAWLDRLDLEQNNLRAAQEWLSAHDRDHDALRLVVALGRFWLVRGYYSEGRTRLSEALANVDTSSAAALRAKAYCHLGRLAQRQGDVSAMESDGQAFLSAAVEFGHRPLLVEAEAFVAETRREAEPDAAGERLREALVLARELGLVAEAGRLLINLGGVAAYLGDATAAMARLAEGLADLRDSGDQWYLATGLNFGCTIATHCGDYRQVGVLAEEYWPIVQALKDRSGQANYWMHRAAAAWWEADWAGSEIFLARALAIYEDADDHFGVAWAMIELSRAELARGDLTRARSLAEEGLARARAIGAAQLVRALWAAGEVALARGEVPIAASRFREGLATPAGRWMRSWRIDLIEGLAKVAASQNFPRRALHLASAASAERARLGATASPIERERLDAALAPARQTLGESTSSLADATGQAMTLEQAVAYALQHDDT